MSDLILLPSTRYEAPSSLRDRRYRGLNTIIEEPEPMSASRGPWHNRTRSDEGQKTPRNVDRFQSRRKDMRIQAWLSPQSDNFPTPKGFPTPRGTHFLEVPTLPSSPSAYSAEDDNESTSASSASGSNPWNLQDCEAGSRSSVMTDSTEFDDMYDTSDGEESRPRRRSSRGSRQSLPRLSIPLGVQPAQDEFKMLTSPVLPTPTLTVSMDASILEDYMARRTAVDPPTAPPSLDGSLTSEQMAQMSAPATPVIGSVDGDNGGRQEEWGGVHLQPGALATLQAISGEVDDDDEDAVHHLPGPVIEIPEEPHPTQEMESRRPGGLTLITSFTPVRGPGSAAAAVAASPLGQRASFAGLTRLDIPSPGGFFSELSPRTRRTWNVGSPNDVAPPTSTTAEQFYRCPWNATEAPAIPLPPPPPRRPAFQPTFTPILSGVSPSHETEAQKHEPGRIHSQSSMSGTLVEHVVEVKARLPEEDDLLTARRVLGSPTPRAENFPSVISQSEQTSATAVDDDLVPTEIVVDYDPEYARKQQEVALANLDRTETWLMAQNKYLQGIVTTTSPQDEKAETIPAVPTKGIVTPADSKTTAAAASAVETLPKKKTVRFSEVIKADIPCSLPSKLIRHESAYYRAFQNYVLRTQRADVFVHRLPRFEALQAQRVSLAEFHMNQLLGKYQLSVVPQSAKKRLSANVARGDDVLLDDPEKLRAEKETEAMSQMAISMWHVAGMRFLNGGRLICGPATKHLARLSTGLSRKDRPRILDLGGQAVSDWAWHVALQHPNAKIYTVTTKAIRQMSNCNVRGPLNHRQVAVERMTRLPFPDEHFDLVSARELHSILKYTTQNGEDEWETCLQECMRVLKPGGYIDFTVMDSDIMKAGPMGLAKSVEFGFTLKRLGYDPEPTKLFLGRLRRAGFQDIQRTWMCLPVGARPASMSSMPAPALRPSPDGSEIKTHKLDAFVTGSSDDIASVCGLVGSWSWERWLLRCEMEKVSGEIRLADTVTTGKTIREAGKSLEGVHGVVEEGRRCGAGWRMLTGYAKKPKPATEMIRIQLA